MKRNEVVKLIKGFLKGYEDSGFSEEREDDADALLSMLEKAGMKPPRVSDEDAQAIMTVYYGGYTLNQWDEELEKDEAVQVAKKRRAEAAALTPEERLQRLQNRTKT